MAPLLRRLGGYIVILAVTLGLLELASFVGFHAVTGKPLDRDALARERAERVSTLEQKLDPSRGVDSNLLYQFHPYEGYTGRPGAHPNKQPGAPPFNAYGIFDMLRHPYPYKHQGDEFVIAVVGGSVASIFANIAEPFVNQALRDEHGIQRRVVLLPLAIAGHKQPQQLFQLQYALLLGFQLDAVLNLDGFNDLVLAEQNGKHGINPIYPSGHHMGLMSQLSTAPDRETTALLAEYYRLLEREASLLRRIDAWGLGSTAFGALLAEVLAKRSTAAIGKVENELQNRAQDKMPESFRGPPFDSAGESIRETSVRIWKEASLLLYAICRSRGLDYVHALQPNQYVEGSKTLSPREQEIAYSTESAWGRNAKAGYGRLREAGAELRALGVPFYDLTQIFKDVQGDIYTDNCCHFHEAGNRILGSHIAAIFAPLIAGKSP